MLDVMKSNCKHTKLDAGGAVKFGFVKLVLICLFAVVTGFLSAGVAQAQAMREIVELPTDCAQLIPPQARGTVQKWQVFVRLEHCDRMTRLRLLSEKLSPEHRPRFYEGVVPAARLPADFGTDLPVLRVVFPDRTFFNTGQYSLRPEARTVAAIVAESLRRMPSDVAMFVAGHADSRGQDEANEALSINRADAVARKIFSEGANLSSIWRIGFGEDMPLHSGQTNADFDRNRRVEFLFSAKPEAVAIWLADQQFGELCQSASEADSAQCRSGLRFRADYEAEKVDHTPRTPTSVRPGGKRTDKVEPTRYDPRQVQMRPPSRAAAIPTGTGKIRVYPVNPRSIPVTIELKRRSS